MMFGTHSLVMDQAQVRAMLAKCGLKNEHISRPLNQLSGGEQAKVRLCKLMMKKVTGFYSMSQQTI